MLSNWRGLGMCYCCPSVGEVLSSAGFSVGFLVLFRGVGLRKMGWIVGNGGENVFLF